MARLTGEAARQWIAQNPGRGFTDARTGKYYGSTPQETKRQPSGFETLALGLSSPFRKGLGIAGEFGGTISDLVKMASGRESEVGEDVFRQLGNLALNEQEQKELKEDPLKVGLKSGAGVASYGIGGGGLGGAVKGGSALERIGSAAKLGSIGGGLGGFSYSEDGSELGSTLGGAALGGVIGGALQGVGEGAKALSRAKAAKAGKIGDQELRAWGVRENAYNKIDGGSEGAKRGVSWIKQEADDLGISIADRYGKERALQPVIDSLSGKVDDIASTMNPIPKAQVVDDITNQIKNIPKYQQKDAFVEIQNILSSYGDELTGPEVRSLYQDIAKAGKTYAVSPSANSNNVRIWRNARNQARSYFTGEAGDLISKMDDIFEVAPFVSKKAGTEWGPNLFGMQFRPALGTKAIDRVGGALTGAPRALMPGQGLAGGIGKLAGLGQRAVPGIVGMGAQAPQQEEFSLDTQGSMGSTQQSQYTFNDAIMEAYSMFPNAPESTILSAAKTLMDQKGGDTDVDTGTMANVQQAIGMIDEFGGSAAGKIPTITGKVGEFFGSASEGTRYRSLISDIRTKMIKQIAGTAQTPAEMKNLIDRLPEPTDEPRVARVKLEVLLNSLQGGFGAPSQNQSINQDYDSWQY